MLMAAARLPLVEALDAIGVTLRSDLTAFGGPHGVGERACKACRCFMSERVDLLALVLGQRLEDGRGFLALIGIVGEALVFPMALGRFMPLGSLCGRLARFIRGEILAQPAKRLHVEIGLLGLGE